MIRYPLDQYDRVWDADEDFSPSHLSMALYTKYDLNTSSINEVPPMVVVQTARLLERRNLLTYDLPLDELGSYYVVLYFAGIVPVSSRFDILANGGIIQSNYSVISRNSTVFYFTMEQIRGLNITLQNISFFPLINAIEVFEIVDIPPETSSTTGNAANDFTYIGALYYFFALLILFVLLDCAVSALEVIQQYTGLDLGWEEDPCFPRPWNHLTCDGNIVTSMYVRP